MGPHLPSARNATAAILIIGAEVLSAKVEDQNGPFMLRSLREWGIETTEVRVINDTVPGIAEAVRHLRGKVTYLFTAGGIGPTHDDVTVLGVAHALDKRVVLDAGLEQRLRGYYGDRINSAHLKLAEVPEGAEVYTCGAGFSFIRIDNMYLLPGVPSFLRECFATLGPKLHAAPFYARALFLNVGESDIAAILETMQQQHPQIAIGSYPRFDTAEYKVKVTIDGRHLDEVELVAGSLRRHFQPHWVIKETHGPMAK